MAKTITPTVGIVRAYAVATGALSPKASKVPEAVKVSYLRDHPNEARALLVSAEAPVGKRGRMSTAQFETAAGLL